MNESIEKTETISLESPALEIIQRAEIDVQISTAKRYPRQLSIVKKDMMSFATLDQETAEACFYTLPRGGKSIQGPSVRLAEIAVSCYGNLRAGSRIIQTVTDGPTPHVVVQAVAHDLEKNVSVTIEKRRRITKKKLKDHIDEDDINLAANAGSAIAFRDAVFKVVPGALIRPVFEQAKRVAIGDAKTLATRRAKCVETFAKMGVTKERVLQHLEKKAIEDIDLADLEILVGLHTAIKDGATTVDEAFPEPKVLDKSADNAKDPSVESATDATGNSQETNQPKNSKTPQQELAEFVIAQGFDFTQFQKWAQDSGNIQNADSLASFDDVPAADAKRFLRSPAGLIRGLNQVKEVAAA